MKRKELKVGDVLYHALPHEWNHDRDGNKVTVVAVEPHKDTSGSWTRERRYNQVATGTGVLVDRERAGGGVVREVVQLGHLRGPYEKIKAEVDARQTESQRQARENSKRADEVRAASEATAARAIAAGYTDVRRNYDLDARLTISAKSLNELLDAVANCNCAGRTVQIEHGWAGPDGAPITMHVEADVDRFLDNVPGSTAYTRQVGPWVPRD